MKNKKIILMGIICALSLGLTVTTHADYTANINLRTAAECGDLNGVITALNDKAYVNDADMDGDTALILAIRNNHMNIIEYLVENVDGTKCCDAGPMDEAYEQNNIEIMQYLCDKGISKISNPQGKIKDSIYFKHFDMAKFLFDNYNINKKSFYDYVWKQFEDYKEADICKLINLNIIEQTDELYTYAFNKGYTRVCDKLKSIKGDEVKLDLSDKEALKKYISDALNMHDKAKLTKVINSGYVDNVNDFLSYLNLYGMDATNNLEPIKFLLNEMGADINYINKNGETLLYNAINMVYANLVEFLLANGAKLDVSCTDSFYSNYNTPLKFANYKVKHCVKKNEFKAEEIKKMLEEAEKKNPNPNAKSETEGCCIIC